MLWSPIIKNSREGSKNNQLNDIADIKDLMRSEYDIEIEAIINHEYQSCLDQLRAYASKETKELKSPVLRMMQIEEKLSKHLRLLKV